MGARAVMIKIRALEPVLPLARVLLCLGGFASAIAPRFDDLVRALKDQRMIEPVAHWIMKQVDTVAKNKHLPRTWQLDTIAPVQLSGSGVPSLFETELSVLA